MKTQAKLQGLLTLLVIFSLFLLSKESAQAGVLDSFWTVVYWMGDSLSKTTVGQALERGLDGLLHLFNIELTGHVRPDYWGALTGKLSTKVGFAISNPLNSSQTFRCEVLEPSMVRVSTDSPWKFDQSVTEYLEQCRQQGWEWFKHIMQNSLGVDKR